MFFKLLDGMVIILNKRKLKAIVHHHQQIQQRRLHYQNYLNQLKDVLNNKYQGQSVYAGISHSKLSKAKTGPEYDLLLNRFRQNVIIPHLLNVDADERPSSRLMFTESKDVTVYGYISDFRQDHRKNHIGNLLIDNPRIMIHDEYNYNKILQDKHLDSHLWVCADNIIPTLGLATRRAISMTGTKMQIGIGDLILLNGSPVSYRSHTSDGKPVYKWRLAKKGLYMVDCGQMISSRVSDKLEINHNIEILSGYDHGDDWVIQYDNLPQPNSGPYDQISRTQLSKYPSYKERFQLK